MCCGTNLLGCIEWSSSGRGCSNQPEIGRFQRQLGHCLYRTCSRLQHNAGLTLMLCCCVDVLLLLQNKMKINDWSAIQTLFDELNKRLERAQKVCHAGRDNEQALCSRGVHQQLHSRSTSSSWSKQLTSALPSSVCATQLLGFAYGWRRNQQLQHRVLQLA